MDSSFNALQQKIIDELKIKIPDLKCPICGNSDLQLVSGFFAHDLQDSFSSRQMGGKNVPTIPIVCKKCTYIMEFSAGVLGLLPKPSNEEKNV